MTYRLCTYGDPVLRRTGDPIPRIDAGIRRLADAMLRIMAERQGVGLAAQQVGQSLMLCVVHVPPALDVAASGGPRLHPDLAAPLVMVNPRVTAGGVRVQQMEGCLSIPEIWAPVTRAAEVTVAYLDLEGRERELAARGLVARAIQHELDHLHGVLFVDRVSPVKKIGLAGRLRRLRRATESALAP